MDKNSFDVAVIGGGVCGAAIARMLSAHELSTVLLEKECDVAFGVSKANSGIIHAGFHHPSGSLKAKLELQGNLMFDRLQSELGFPFKRTGIIVAAFSDEEMKTVLQLFEQGEKNGVQGMELCSSQRLFTLEPGINRDATGGLYAPSGGIVEPYRFVFALVENGCTNGLTLKTGFKLTSVESCNDLFFLCAENGERIIVRYAVNAAGLDADSVSRMFHAEKFTISPRKGEEFLLDRTSKGCPNHVLFPVPAANSKGILVIPTVEGTTMVGPTAVDVESKSDLSTSSDNLDTVFAHAKHLFPTISRRDIITSFAGLRPAMEGGDFYIAQSAVQPRLIQVAGIQSPGLTASPAIAEYVKKLLKAAGCRLVEKPYFKATLPEVESMRNRTPESMDALISRDRAYGEIVCRCENVSEAQIVEAIRKGHTTLDGIKLYTRAGMGRCQGGFCTYKILRILSRETGKKMTEFTKRGGESRLLAAELSEETFNSGEFPEW